MKAIMIHKKKQLDKMFTYHILTKFIKIFSLPPRFWTPPKKPAPLVYQKFLSPPNGKFQRITSPLPMQPGG